MHLSTEVIPAILLAYLIGSLSTAILVCKIMRLSDPRLHGSGNPGATNVLRLGNKKAAIITLLGDIAKGMIPIGLAKWYGLSICVLSGMACAAFLGHLYPIFFHFKGGKGVATAFGCFMALSGSVGLALLATWLTIAIIFRYSSLAALVTASLAPFYTWYFTNSCYTATACIISGLLIFRHRNNIRNLLTHQENKIGKRKIEPTDPPV